MTSFPLDAITEPSAVAPDARVNFEADHFRRAMLNPGSGATALGSVMVQLEKPSQQIEDQAQRERHQQHRNNRDIDLRAFAFVVDVARQFSKPVQSS